MQSDPRLALREYILREFLEGEDPNLLENGTALISSGVINSLSFVRLIDFIEKNFDVTVAPYQMTADYFDTIDQMARFIAERRK
jgi:acyl carrier protein